MVAYNAYNQYRENSINTANPEELTLLLYNGLVKFIMRSIDNIGRNKIEESHNNIIRAQDIIIEFMNTLDMSYDISKSMYLIYDYMLSRLIEANISKDRNILQEVLGFAKEFRDSWQQAIKISKSELKKQSV
jgi:flagellar protein FliS